MRVNKHKWMSRSKMVLKQMQEMLTWENYIQDNKLEIINNISNTYNHVANLGGNLTPLKALDHRVRQNHRKCIEMQSSSRLAVPHGKIKDMK